MILDNKLYVLPLILFVILLWAGNFVSISYIVKEMDVFTALTLRLAMVAILLFPFLRRLPNQSDFLVLFLATTAIVPGHFGLLFLSILNTKSVGGISVLIQLSIPFSILFAWLLFKDRPSNLRIVGLLIAFTGIVFLLYDPSLLDSRNAFILAIGSAFCLGIYFIIIKKLKNVKSLAVIAWTSLLGSPMMYIFMFYTNNSFSSILEIQNNSTLVAFCYTVIAGSILGHGLWAYLVKTQDISFISPFLLLVPMFAVVLSSIFLNEEITFSFIITSSVIVFGIFLVFISKNVKNNLKD
ncbi:DMT family transporter [Poseidonibacter lekithochrous]|uniref:DMT family transporter n=1 Tax=Poseidonibacter lekithochrous TaxID=1904463 RepID=UPI0008FC6B37|nr:DMT family transporter [Poseidonibacter lekithochrous]QKJ21787.1 DMT family transporter [Poseidonibacter lekithochrous]